MLKVTNTVEAVEVGGSEVHTSIGQAAPVVTVQSHWNINRYVVLSLPEGKSVTVLARDLQAAVSNATNVGRT